MANRLRVAVAGASGIGKHHAKWYHLAGCEVIGFLGSNQDSCAATAPALGEIFPFSGKGYWDWEELLGEARPDLVDICTPNELHHAHASRALEAGCHVLCEKPLVWDPAEEHEKILEKGREMVESAREKGLKLGVCTQYAMALPHYAQLCGAELEGGQIESFYAEMETLARGRQRSPFQIWIDMGSHPLSLLLAWIPDGAIAAESLRVDFQGCEARARFDFVSAQGRCPSEIVVRDLEEGAPVRRFGVNGAVVDCSGRPDESGAYCAVLSRGAEEEVGTDFMSLLVSQFIAAVEEPQKPVPVSGETGLRNLELLVEVLQGAALPD